MLQALRSKIAIVLCDAVFLRFLGVLAIEPVHILHFLQVLTGVGSATDSMQPPSHAMHTPSAPRQRSESYRALILDERALPCSMQQRSESYM